MLMGKICRVGCVIVAADGAEVLAKGYHKRKGGPHAEAAALADAKARGVTPEQMSGATCYVTLEPCHRGPGKTTPPCDEALVASGLRNLHLAVMDPDVAFGNAGVTHLESHGVQVTVGTGADAVARSLRPYLHQRATKAPYVVLKVASTADGAIACADATSQWITGPGARAHSQQLRASSQAILVGSGTALADSPRLTVRVPEEELPPGYMKERSCSSSSPQAPCLEFSLPCATLVLRARSPSAPPLTVVRAPCAARRRLPPIGNPLRVLLDARGRVDDGPLLDTILAPTLIFTTAASQGSSARTAWEAAGVDVCEVPAAAHCAGDTAAALAEGGGDGAGVHLPAVLAELGARGIIQVMVEVRAPTERL